MYICVYIYVYIYPVNPGAGLLTTLAQQCTDVN